MSYETVITIFFVVAIFVDSLALIFTEEVAVIFASVVTITGFFISFLEAPIHTGAPFWVEIVLLEVSQALFFCLIRQIFLDQMDAKSPWKDWLFYLLLVGYWAAFGAAIALYLG